MSSVPQQATSPLSTVLRSLEDLGRQMAFHRRAITQLPYAARHYRPEVRRLLAEVSLGSGALALVGGTVVIITAITMATGAEIGMQGYAQLRSIGVPALAGFISAYINTREGAPLIAAVALIATVGGGFTAQLGAMRVAEEIDALETMAVRSVAFLVSTRILAGLIAIVPLYAVALIMAYTSTQLVIATVNGQAMGTYAHYFSVFLVPTDVLFSLLKLVVMAVVIILVHCYYGFTATGGPVGVGTAVGRAVRTSLILVMITDLALSLILYGRFSTLAISG